MISLTLLVICAVLSICCTRSSYWVLRFCAGSAWTTLGVYWINNPILAAGSTEQQLVIIILFGIAFAFYLMILWNSNGETAGRFQGGIRRLFVGEQETPRTLRENRELRNARYQERVDAAMRGERRR